MRNLLPVFIQRQYQQGRFSGQMPVASVFVDISGFTRMTDVLMQHGKEGIETLSEILGYIFEPSARSIYARGGFVATYAGDAFTAVFPAEADPSGAAQRALLAAQEIIQFFRERGVYDSPLGQFAFSAKAGLGFGDAEWGILGDDTSRLFYFRGEAINACAEAEHYAEAGELWAERTFFSRLPVEYPPDRAQGNFAPLALLSGLETPAMDSEPPFFSEREMRLFSGEREYDFPEGEFREVISVFLSFDSLPDFPSFVNTLLALQRRYGGSHPRLDFGDKGNTALLFFGAPIAYENKEERALEFITELWRQVPAPAKIKAGLTRGVVYAGFYGATLQQSFSGLGSAVNQAARFMVRAEWGQILTGAEFLKTPGYAFSYLGDFVYKGRTQPVPTYALLAADAPVRQPRSLRSSQRSLLLIGRERELHFLRAALEPLRSGRFGGVLYVDGEAGLGKSYLLQAFRQETPQYQWFFLPCDEVLRKSLNPLVYFLREYFGQNEAGGPSEKRQRFETRFNQLFQQTRQPDLKRDLKRGRPFLAALLQLEGEEAPLKKLDAQARHENALDALKTLIKAESARQPLILHLEDAHWIDLDSREFFRQLTRNVENSPFLLLAACRYRDDGSLFQLSLDEETPRQRLTLTPLSKPEAGKLAAFTLQRPSMPLPPPTLEFLYRRSEGNPFFIEQICLYLSENQLLDEQNNLDVRLLSGQAEMEIPSTINAILVARIDRLTAELKEIVKTASVLGQEFTTSIFSSMLRKVSSLPVDALHDYLKAGEEQAIWQAVSELRYLFKHALIREAVYGMQLKKRLRALHKLAAESIEELFQADLKPYYTDLAEHYEKARLPHKATHYLGLAAQMSLDLYRNHEAAALYERLLQYSLAANDELSAWENKGKAQRMYGDWEAARQTFERMLERAEALNAPLWQAKAANALAYLLLAHGNVDQALPLAEQAQMLALQSGSHAEQAQALSNLGFFYNVRGERERARQIHSQMLTLARETNDLPAIVTALFRLREYLLQEGTLLSEFENYLHQAETQNDLRLMSRLWFYIGDIHLLQHNYTAAEQANRRMLEVVQQIGDKQGMCYAIGDRGIVLSELGRFDEAVECYREKLVLAHELGDGYNIWEGLVNWGTLHAYQRHYAEAAGLFQAAAQTARKYTLQGELIYTLLTQAENSLDQGALEEARRLQSEADALNAATKDDTLARQSRLLTARLQRDLPLLDELLASAPTKEERANLLFERWRLTAAESDRRQAQALYQTLYAQSPRYLYQTRLAALEAKP